MMAKQLSGKQAAIEILREKGGPMPVKQLCEEAVKRAPGMKGKTPTATIAATIYTAAKKGKTFRMVERGVVELLDETQEPEAKPETESAAVTPGSVVLRDGNQAKPDPKPTSDKKKTSRRKPKAAAVA
jgi:hypothetical protein